MTDYKRQPSASAPPTEDPRISRSRRRARRELSDDPKPPSCRSRRRSARPPDCKCPTARRSTPNCLENDREAGRRIAAAKRPRRSRRISKRC